MTKFIAGNILDDDAQALTNPVNTAASWARDWPCSSKNRRKKKHKRRTNAISPRPDPHREVVLVRLLPLREAGAYEDFKWAVLDQWADRDKPGRCEKCGLTTFHYIMAGGEAWEQCAICHRTYLRGYPLRKRTAQEAVVELLVPAMQRVFESSPIEAVTGMSDKLFDLLAIPPFLLRL